MPKLINFYNIHADLHNKFEIIAFHDTTCKTFDELDEKLKKKKIIDKAWGGQDLPFPVLLDTTGETMKRYKLERFPTILLIDPDGNLVGEGDEEDLAKKLGITPPTSS